MPVVVIGLNHRTAPLAVREAMTVGPDAVDKTLDALLGAEHLSETVVLSTCNRTEVYAVAERFHGGYADIRRVLAEVALLEPDDFADHLYVHHDTAAASHLFEVVSGLDSAVLGEHEIQGQVKTAWEAAKDADAVGPTLNLLFRHAIEAGKRVRSETAIGKGTASVSYSAVALAADHFTDAGRDGLRGARAVVLGVGDMGASMATSLADAGVGDLVVANRTHDTARTVAKPLDARAVRFTDLPGELVDADVLLTSTGAASVLLTYDEMATVVERRDGRELLLVDIAVPRDVDPAVADLPGVTVLDMDDLTDFADAGLAERRREIDTVKALLDEELERFGSATSAREVAPAIVALRSAAEETRTAELDRMSGRLAELDDDQFAAVDKFSRALVAKLLHQPTVALRDAAGTSKGDRLIQALRDLFDIDDEP
ncbi:MAG: glutamyl-tRNA reductase [Acidimicrobiales bacterium]|nr:glutamyl-tRNA reductase [Acidimicrobiales bacterium]